MDLTANTLRQISMYTINKETNDQSFGEPLDTSRVDDATLSQFTVRVANSNYATKDLRDLIFVEGSSVKGWVTEILHNRADANLFKQRTKDIAEKLFTVTQINWKKGDLLHGLFERTDQFIFVILKIDENNYIKRGQDGLWLDDVGFSKDIKLQKGIYITIPKIETAFELNHLNWCIQSIDKISGDAHYWNNTFLDANFKRDDKTNTIQFNSFFKKYVNTIPDPEEKFRINYQYLHYAKNNDAFSVDTFLSTIYGDNDVNREKRDHFRNEIQQASQDLNFDLTFGISRQHIKKDLKPGKYVIDSRISIVYDKGLACQEDTDRALERQVKFKDTDGNPFTDGDGQKYAKVFYDNYEYKQ